MAYQLIWSPAGRRWLYLAAGAAAYGAIVFYTDPFLLSLFAYLSMCLTGLCVLLVFLMLGFAAAKQRPLRTPVLLLAGCVITVGLMTLSLPINEFLQERAVADAMAYPERVAAPLEQYRRERGAYPSSLDRLPSHPPVPRLLRGSNGYRSNGQHYIFSFPQPGGLLDEWNYDCDTRTWDLST